jgi:hypothetical protein
MSTAEPPVPESSRRPAWPSLLVGAAVIALALLAFLLLRGGDDDPAPAASGTSGATAAAARPVATTPARLEALAASSGRPIFWVGPSRGRTYELTRTADGSTYVRYLDAGVPVGDPRPDFLTVGTYPQEKAFETVREASERAGAQVEELDDDGLAVANRSRPNSWYLAFPDSDELVEVFSPKAGRARELVRTERIVPVKG